MRFDTYLLPHSHATDHPPYLPPSPLQPMMRYDETRYDDDVCVCWVLGYFSVLAILMTIIFSFPSSYLFFPALFPSTYPLRTVDEHDMS